jgi:hypothetical protein
MSVSIAVSPKPKKAKAFSGFSTEKQAKAQAAGKFYVVGTGGTMRSLRGAPITWKKEEQKLLELKSKGLATDADVANPDNYSVYIPLLRVSGRSSDLYEAGKALTEEQRNSVLASSQSWITIKNWNDMLQSSEVQRLIQGDGSVSSNKARTVREAKKANVSQFSIDEIIAATKFTKDMQKSYDVAARPAKRAGSPGGRRTAQPLYQKVKELLPKMETKEVTFLNVSEYPAKGQGKPSKGTKKPDPTKHWVSSFLPIFSTTLAGAQAALQAIDAGLRSEGRIETVRLQQDLAAAQAIFAANPDLTRHRPRRGAGAAAAVAPSAASARPAVAVPTAALPQGVTSPGGSAGGLVPATGIPVLPGTPGFGAPMMK